MRHFSPPAVRVWFTFTFLAFLFLSVFCLPLHAQPGAGTQKNSGSESDTESNSESVQLISPNALGTVWEHFVTEEIRTFEELQSDTKAQWKEILLPASVHSRLEEIQWYRTEFSAPVPKENEFVFLCFDGVRFDAQIFIDGEKAGTYRGGGEPFELDVTRWARKGGAHQLVVRLEGATALAKNQPETLQVEAGHRAAELFSQSLLYPVGSQGFSWLGIWEPVRLEVRNTLQVEDLFIQTSWREKKITVDFQVKNLSGRDVSVPVSAKVDETEIDFGTQNVEIPAGETVSFRMERPWKNPRVWCPRDPHLYFLNVQMGEFLTRRERFGFREIWCDGDLFVLNGVPFHALGTASHPRKILQDGESREAAKEFFISLRKANINCVRLHANYWPKGFCETADELGMPLILESGFFCWVDTYALNDTEFWVNFDWHIRALQKKHRNNPAFCFLSMCNEILHCGGERLCPNVEHLLAESGRKARSLDGTRPISFDGDMDPEGSADVVNPHYPMDYAGRYTGHEDLEWPQDCWWIDSGKFMACYPHEDWKWDRKKPLYFGEFLHIQHFTDSNPYSLLLGDETYTQGFSRAMSDAKGKAWRMQIPAYRAAGVTGLCPWVIVEHSSKTMDSQENARYAAVVEHYEPVSFAMEPTPASCFEGSSIPLKFWLLNDSDAVRDLTLKVTLPNGKSETVTRRLNPAGREPVEVTLSTAGIQDANASQLFTEAKVQIELTHEAVLVSEKPEWNPNWERSGKMLPAGEDRYFLRNGSVKREFTLRVGRKLQAGTFGIAGTVGAAGTAESAEAAGESENAGKPGYADLKVGFIGDSAAARDFGAVHLQDLNDPRLTEMDALIIGKDQLARLFPVSEEDGKRKAVCGSLIYQPLVSFLENPNRKILVLEQSEYPAGLFPVQLAGVKLSDPRNTEWVFFPSVEPFLFPEDLAFSPINPLPEELSDRFGGPNGFEYCPILQAENLILCQYPVETLRKTSPALALLPKVLLERSVKPAVSVLVYDPSREIQPQLAGMKVPFQEIQLSSRRKLSEASREELDQVSANAQDSRKTLVLVNSAAEPILPERGETFVLCGMNSEHQNRWKKLLPENLLIVPFTGTCTRTDEFQWSCRTEDERFGLFTGASADLYWLGNRSGLTYRQQTPILPTANHQIFPFAPNYAEQLQFPVKSYREFTSSTGKSRDFGTHLFVGTQMVLESPLEAPPGFYFLELTGLGTTVQGIGVQLDISVDGKFQGQVEFNSGEMEKKGILIWKQKENSELQIHFTNDLWDPVTREDRNLKFVSAQLIPCQEAHSFRTTIYPVSAAKVQENLVLDCVNWFGPENEKGNSSRWIKSILENAGVRSSWALGGTKIGAFDLDEIRANLFSKSQRGVPTIYQGGNGSLLKKVTFAKAGKYSFTLRASGTACEEIYPHVNLRLNGKIIGEFQVTQTEFRNYFLPQNIEIPAGEHQIELQFDNDKYIPSEDPAIPHQDCNFRFISLEILPVKE